MARLRNVVETRAAKFRSPVHKMHVQMAGLRDARDEALLAGNVHTRGRPAPAGIWWLGPLCGSLVASLAWLGMMLINGPVPIDKAELNPVETSAV